MKDLTTWTDQEEVNEKVTVIVTTYGGGDFLNATLSALRDFYPHVRIIVVDGHNWSNPYTRRECNPFKAEAMAVPGACIEDCRNAAAAIVETPMILFMDDDVKILDGGAIEMLVDILEDVGDAVQTGAYCLKVADWETRIGYVGTEFNGFMEVDACPAYFSLHCTNAYRQVGGMPKHDLFYPVDETSDIAIVMQRQDLAGYSGDFSISKLYRQRGGAVISPERRIPVLHWGHRWKVNDKLEHDNRCRDLENWWYLHTTHIRCNPLNAWPQANGRRQKPSEKTNA